MPPRPEDLGGVGACGQRDDGLDDPLAGRVEHGGAEGGQVERLAASGSGLALARRQQDQHAGKSRGSREPRLARVLAMPSNRVITVRTGDDTVSAETLRDGIAAIQAEMKVTPEFPEAVERAAAAGRGRRRDCPTWTGPTCRS